MLRVIAKNQADCLCVCACVRVCVQMLPVIDKNQSDSGSYDNVLEFLYHGSERTLPECMLMMIPEPWQV
jgi:glutamate synthase domain-containing protein 1